MRAKMKRREFITLLGAAAAWPLAVRAQRSGLLRAGLLYSSTSFQFSDFQEGLREAGFVDGQNVLFERRFARGDYERLPALAAELLALPVDLLTAFGTPAVRAAKTASMKSASAISIIFAMAADPVTEGFVESFNRPGGNMTGITSISSTLAPKRLDLMREFFLGDAPIAMIINPHNPFSEAERRDTEVAVRAVNGRVEFLTASNQAEIDQAFAAIRPGRFSIVIISGDNFYLTQMQRMAALATQARVPAIGPVREFAAEGGLLSYGANIADVVRQAGVMAGKVLKGAKPAELPVQQPTKFELVVNLKTAKALGLTIPDKLLALADEVIE
jgi:putative tryptophan/tyrosine transport system substrate-binding protein